MPKQTEKPKIEDLDPVHRHWFTKILVEEINCLWRHNCRHGHWLFDREMEGLSQLLPRELGKGGFLRGVRLHGYIGPEDRSASERRAS